MRLTEVTSLLDNVLDRDCLSKVLNERKTLNKLFDPKLNKLILPSNDLFDKAIEDNFNTIWRQKDAMGEVDKRISTMHQNPKMAFLTQNGI